MSEGKGLMVRLEATTADGIRVDAVFVFPLDRLASMLREAERSEDRLPGPPEDDA